LERGACQAKMQTGLDFFPLVAASQHACRRRTLSGGFASVMLAFLLTAPTLR
jgi:hypothetical protein